MKYIVSLGWHGEYEFESGLTALRFAELALNHKEDDEDFSYKVKIEIVKGEGQCDIPSSECSE